MGGRLVLPSVGESLLGEEAAMSEFDHGSGLAVVILAAGKGKRMNSYEPKVLHPILGEPMISYVVDLVDFVPRRRKVVVTGYKAERVKEFLADRVELFAYQREQLGTAHAVLCAKPQLHSHKGSVLILNGDLPLLRRETLDAFVEAHRASRSVMTLMTTHMPEPAGYGRIVRDADGGIAAVVEDADATDPQKGIDEVNAGVYCVEASFLWDALALLNPNNRQHEYYLPDLIGIALAEGLEVNTFTVPESTEVLGVNTRAELAAAQRALCDRVNRRHMDNGVTILDPATTYISPRVTIDIDTVVHPCTHIYGRTSIGWGCSLGPSAWIKDAVIAHDVVIGFCTHVEGAEILDGAAVGPFARLRPGTRVGSHARVGNFVEIKNSRIGRSTKVSHLSYVGDATVGDNVNVGAGTVTCNYDGFSKHRTVIEDDVFLGSDTMLVAPVRVGKGATTAAGSTITEDVPPGSLALGRARQVVKENWKRRPKGSKTGGE